MSQTERHCEENGEGYAGELSEAISLIEDMEIASSRSTQEGHKAPRNDALI